jgi:phosphatidylserine/phosphatidylglycerophosphate/cardiolipin synthase-like enzyme
VNVCVLHDVLTSELDPELSRRFVESGGLEYRLNGLLWVWNIPTRRYFKRDHEKLIVADDALFLGSANISIDYARRRA